MSVDVTTLVTDPSGKPKHQSHATVSMVFNGYNEGSGKFTLHANSGMLSAGAMHDSLSGDLAAFFAGGLLQKSDPDRTFEVRQSTVSVKNKTCPPLEPMPRWMFPLHACGAVEFTVIAGSHGGPAPAKVTYLGDVQLTAFHADVEFQENILPGQPDNKPYLWPLTATTSLTTSKGKLTIANRYSPRQKH